jgi:hypothetical protein
MSRQWVRVGRLGHWSNDGRFLRDVHVPASVPARVPDDMGSIEQMTDGSGAIDEPVVLRVDRATGWIEASLKASWGTCASLGLGRFTVTEHPEHDDDDVPNLVLDGNVAYVMVGPGMGHAWAGQD